MLSRRQVLKLAAMAFVGALPAMRSIAAQQPKTATVTLIIEGMT